MARRAKGKRDPNFPMQGRGGAMGGQYGSKSTNLSKSVLKRAGAAKAAAKRTVSISQTKRVGSRTMGPAGKPLTGTVTLLNGKTAVYKNGRRVEASMAKPKASKPAAASSARSAASSAGDKPRTAKSMMKLKKGDTVRTSLARDTARAGAPRQGSPASTRTSNSGTVSSAIAQGKRGGAGSGSGSKPGTKEAMVGYVRGNPYAQQSAVTARRTGRQSMPGSVIAKTKNKREQDKRNQGRNAAAIAGLTVVPLAAAGLAGTGAGAAAAGAAGRAAATAGKAAARGAGKVTRPVLGGTSKSGKSTTNKVSIAVFKAQQRASKAKAARAKAKAARGK